jgi:hypothetical protein
MTRAQSRMSGAGEENAAALVGRKDAAQPRARRCSFRAVRDQCKTAKHVQRPLSHIEPVLRAASAAVMLLKELQRGA